MKMTKRERNSRFKIEWEKKVTKELDEIKNWDVMLNRTLTNAISKECRDKSNLLTLTGGMDTRALLSIFIKNDIDVDCYTYYNKVTAQGKVEKLTPQKITEHYNINWILKEGDGYFFEKLPSLRKRYDTVISGLCMSEYLSPLEYYQFSQKRIRYYQEMKAKEGEQYKLFLPILDKDVQEVIQSIPIKYLLFSAINKKIITMNEPDLLNYPGTSYNLKRSLIKTIYRAYVKVT